MSFLSLEQCKAAVSALDNEPFRYLAEFVSIPFPLTAISYKAHTNYLLNRSAIANLDVREIQGGAMTYASGSIQMVEFLAENDIQFITRFGLVVPDEINAYREIEQVDEEGKLEYVVKEFSEQPTSVVVVRGLVYPERDLKREPYLTILIYFNSGANLFAAYCECKAGGKFKSICKHCSAVCCLLEQLKVHGNSSLLEYNTCTMEPCGWIAPRDRFASGVPIHDIVFKKRNKKILPENSDRKYRSDRGQDRARSPTPEVRILTPEDVKAFSEEIAEEPCYKDRKPAIAILARCPAVQPMRRPIPPPATRLEQPISRSRPLLPCDNINYTLGPIYFHGATDEIKNRAKEIYSTFVEKDLHQCRVLEELTRSQSASPLWIEARFCPITASNAKDYARKMKWDKFLLDNHGQAFNKRKFITAAMKAGLESEKDIILLYLEDVPIHVDIAQTGFITHPAFPWLGCSPDGICWDDSEIWLIEVKLHNTTGRIRQFAQSNKDFCLRINPDTNQLELKENHKYSFQVQTQMGVSGVHKCAFTIASKGYFDHLTRSVIKFTDHVSIMVEFNEDFFINEIVWPCFHKYFFYVLPFMAENTSFPGISDVPTISSSSHRPLQDATNRKHRKVTITANPLHHKSPTNKSPPKKRRRKQNAFSSQPPMRL